jgi:hypothetical protein
MGEIEMSYPRYSSAILASNDYVKEADYDPLVAHYYGSTTTGIVAGPYSFLIRNVGGVYEAIDAVGVLTYGGSADAGTIDGDDFSAVIQACIDILVSGGLINITAGNYAVNTQIDLDNNIRIVGSGLQSTILTLATGITGFKSAGLVATPKFGVQLENFTILGDSIGVAQVGVEMNYTYSNTAFFNIQIKDVGGVGLKLVHCYATRYIGVEVVNCNDMGIYASNCHGAYFNVKLYDNGVTESTPNIWLGYCCRAKVECVSEGYHGSLLHVDETGGSHSEGISITGYFEGTKRVTIKNCYGTVIYGSRFVGTGAADYGIVVDGNTEQVTIRDTTFAGAYSGSSIWLVAGTVLFTALRDISCTTTATDFISDGGGGTIYENIKDLVLEKYGSATILNGASTVEITHGLSNVPYYILITSTSHALGRVVAYDETTAHFHVSSENVAVGNTTIWWHAVTIPLAGWEP